MTIKGNYVLITRSYLPEVELAKDLVDRLTDKLKASIVFVANEYENKIVFICKNKVNSLHAGNLVKMAAIHTNGNGG
ncbi:MAG: DHHA1 domain-containing protein, partial [Bacilli bacterium]|nr:DHHA1 domain-containing protein [Bacilli bacterium]